METSPFGIVNLGILLLYLAAMLAIGLHFMRRQQDTEAYFLASRAMPWLPVAMSMFASLTSAVTFMGLPARAYEENVSLLVVCIVSPLLVPLLTLVLYPAYRKQGVTTSYEFIGMKFGRPGRTAVSALFILARLGWMGTVIYAPAMALSVATGLPLPLTISLMGIMATAYTALGGLAAVLWTDVVQFIILVGGAFWIAITLAQDVNGGIEGILSTALEAGRFDIASLSLNLFQMSGLAVGISFFLQMLQDYGTDQVTVQRMLAIKDDRGVFKASLFNAGTDFFMIALLHFIGLGLFALYQQTPPPDALPADSVLPHFIIHNLPVGISGLLIAAIFAAAMSSMDSGINSLATVIENDFIKHFNLASPQHAVRRARWLTVGLGLLATALAFYVSQMSNIIAAFATFMGLFNAPVLALFILAFLCRHARFAAWCVSLPIAIGITWYAKKSVGIHWVYLFPLSFLVSFSISWSLSMATRKMKR